jgi:prepilin-type processing-associated H-X9-DG protein
MAASDNGQPPACMAGRWGRTPNSPPTGTSGDNRQFNCTTIRYPLNKKYQSDGWSANGGNGTQSGDCQVGVCYDLGNNIPLNSTHSGGVNALLGDGSVRFLADNTSLPILALSTVRDDGKPAQLP